MATDRVTSRGGTGTKAQASLLVLSAAGPYRVELVEGLLRRNYRVEAAGSADAARRILPGSATDLVVLDPSLEDADGLVLLAELRASFDVPMILVSRALTPADVVVGLHLGADDVVAPSCPIEELDARIWAILRRTRFGWGHAVSPPTGTGREGATERQSELAFGPLVMDVARGRIAVHGAALTLTPTQGRILTALLRAPDRFMTKKNLVEQVWGHTDADAKRSIDVHISQLRQRLRQASRGAPTLITLRLVAYQLVLVDDAEYQRP